MPVGHWDLRRRRAALLDVRRSLDGVPRSPIAAGLPGSRPPQPTMRPSSWITTASAASDAPRSVTDRPRCTETASSSDADLTGLEYGDSLRERLVPVRAHDVRAALAGASVEGDSEAQVPRGCVSRHDVVVGSAESDSRARATVALDEVSCESRCRWSTRSGCTLSTAASTPVSRFRCSRASRP